MLTREAGDARLHRRAIPAEAPGFRRVVLRGTPYPTLTPGSGIVTGLLIRPTPATLTRLRAYEGPFYRLVPLRVRTARGAVQACAWMAPSWRAAPRPWP